MAMPLRSRTTNTPVVIQCVMRTKSACTGGLEGTGTDPAETTTAAESLTGLTLYSCSPDIQLIGTSRVEIGRFCAVRLLLCPLVRAGLFLCRHKCLHRREAMRLIG